LNSHDGKRLITLTGVTLRVGGRLLLPGTFWEIREGENWAILGPNGSGKSALARVIKGDIPHVRGELTRHNPEAAGEKIGYVSFELQEQILLREERLAEARFFSGKQGEALTAGELLMEQQADRAVLDRLVKMLVLAPLLAHGLRTLSNGEFRKILIARALLRSPKLLILDDPFAGLDVDSRTLLSETITDLMSHGTQIILVTQREEEIITGISHVLLIRDERVAQTGTRSDVMTPASIKSFLSGRIPLPEKRRPPLPLLSERTAAEAPADPLVEMQHVAVSYGDLVVFRDFNWTVRHGENWAVVGPNGSGKTTLLGLITGDNLQVYANQIALFGKWRGDGESIWEIRRKLGVVSPELQLLYRRQVSVREVILSGFFDSIGLYRKATKEHVSLADRWLEFLGMMDRADRPFLQLSYGEKRMALIVRAMVKSPELLLLDEPCQGLDPSNRELVLELIEGIGSERATCLIYITHHEEEMIPSIDHILKLEKGNQGDQEKSSLLSSSR
jgi:molybdate transport system ATP-binding protein